MDAVSLLRQQFKECNEWLEATMQGVTPEQAHWKPAGKANPLGATYAHTLMTQDFVANSDIKGGAPLAATTWAKKIGISEPPPMDVITEWAQWARLVQVNLEALRAYGQAVRDSVDQVLMSLTETGLSRAVETPFGSSTVQFLLSGAIIGHTHNHAGSHCHASAHQGAGVPAGAGSAGTPGWQHGAHRCGRGPRRYFRRGPGGS